MFTDFVRARNGFNNNPSALQFYHLNTEIVADQNSLHINFGWKKIEELPNPLNISMFSENVVTYISGSVVRMAKKLFRCEECCNTLTQLRSTLPQSQSLIISIDLGTVVYNCSFIQI